MRGWAEKFKTDENKQPFKKRLKKMKKCSTASQESSIIFKRN